MRKILPLISILILLFAGTIKAQVSTDSLQACFLFNGNTNDTSGKGRHASILGNGISLTTDRYGNPNSAYSFTGQDGRINANIGSHTDEVTIALWYYSDGQTTPYPHFFDYGDYKFRCHVMWGSIYNSNDRYGILCETYNPQGNMIRGSVKPTNSTWTHVTVTFNKTTQKQKLFINGVFDREMTIGNGQLNLSDDILCIGRVRSGATSQTSMTYFNGKIDDLYVYSRELDSAEIVSLATLSNPNTSVQPVENTVEPVVTIYPNPTNDVLNFTVSTELNLDYKIHDITGKLIQSGSEPSSINVGNIPNGVYFITFHNAAKDFISVKKFIKE